MRELYISIATAAVGGLLMGMALRPHDLKEGPAGPQMIASERTTESALASLDPIAARVGPLPDYVLGTDFTRPKVREPEYAAVYDAAYTVSTSYGEYLVPAVQSEPAKVREEAAPRATSAADMGVDAVETFHDGGGEEGQIVRADHEGRGQIDNLAHGPNPYAEFSEPSV